MSTQFANTLNNHPIYADRAEKDAAGNTITTTYQEKLTAGTGINIDSSNVISATGGGGTTYTAGTGIDISAQDAISVKIDGSTITTNGSGQLVANSGGGTSYTAGTGIDISAQDAISVKIDGSTITTNGSGQLVANGGGGTSYTAGTGIDITSNTIGVKIDGSTITTNASGQLVANGGGGGGSGLTVVSTLINGNLYQDQHFFTIDGLSVDYKYDTTGGYLKKYISVSSSTVSTAYIDKRWSRFARADGSGNLDRWIYSCSMPNSATSPYTGVSLSSPCHLIDINSDGTTDLSEDTQYAEYPTSFDFRIYYEVNNMAKVIYLNVFIWSTGQSNGSYNVRYSYSHG